MIPEVRYFPQARLDLIDQATYLTEHGSPKVAERFLRSAEQTAQGLALMPKKGHPWKSPRLKIKGELRVFKIKEFPNILLFYRPEDNGISVVRVLHRARDIPAVLESII